MLGERRLILVRLIESRNGLLPRPARRFLDSLLNDQSLLDRMRFCTPDDRRRLRNSVLICTHEVPCWAVLLGNDPDRPGTRVRLALEGLDLTVQQVLERLRSVPVWFLAVDPDLVTPSPGEAERLENTIYRLSGAVSAGLRRVALLDQIDAALDAKDRAAYERLQSLLTESES